MYQRLNIEDVQKLAHSKKGKLISKIYINSHQKLIWQCEFGHTWKAKHTNIKYSNQWCPKCSVIKRRVRIFDGAKKIAKEKGAVCLSNKYSGYDSKLRWRCSKGHTFLMSPKSIRQGKWCAACYGNVPLGIDLMKKTAHKRGGECLSKIYQNTYTNLLWKCKKKHVFKKTARSVLNGVWCNKCERDKVFEDLKKILIEKKGKFISKNFKNQTDTYKFECEKKHRWTNRASLIIKGQWCPNCAGSAKLSLNDLKNVAKKRGGKLLSKKYGNIGTRYSWICKEGHKWKATAANVIHKNSWCPQCHFYFSEEICRTTFEQLFKTKFPKSRPNWLMGLKGRLMELDGYSKKLGIAFEYHGEQHFKDHFYIKDKRMLKYGLERDREKIKLCKNNDIKLIIITYKDDLSMLPQIIKNQTKKLLISRKVNFETNINFDKIYNHKTKIQELKDIAAKKGGKCLSKKYFGALKKIEWECSNSHTWFQTPDKIRRGYWCGKCSGKAPLSLDVMKKIALDRGGKCLSKKYMGNRFPLKWQCAFGHIWKARPYSIKNNGSWCRKCYNQKLSLN